MKTQTTGLTVTTQTAMYVEALRAQNAAADEILRALVNHYGEQQGDNFYQTEFAPLFEDLRKQTADFLTISINENIGVISTPDTI